MLELVRSGRVVTCNGHKLTMVEQATKGAGNEVIKIEGLEGANGAKWISLSKLQEGLNKVEVKGKEVTATQTYVLNMVEKAEVDRLQGEINKIKEAARLRYVQKPKFVDPSSLTQEEKLLKAAEVQKYLDSLKA